MADVIGTDESWDEVQRLVDGKEQTMPDDIYPAPTQFRLEQIDTDPILRFFHFSHLPEKLQQVSAPFCLLAEQIVCTLPRNAERSVALRKLLEAKDAAVRANVE